MSQNVPDSPYAYMHSTCYKKTCNSSSQQLLPTHTSSVSAAVSSLSLQSLQKAATTLPCYLCWMLMGQVCRSVRMMVTGEGRPKGIAFAEFATPVEAETALAMDRQMLGSRYVELFMSTPEEVARATSF